RIWWLRSWGFESLRPHQSERTAAGPLAEQRIDRTKPKMQVTETNAEGLKREYAILVPAADIQAQVTAKLEEIARTIRLPGFRPGKAPLSVLRQRYGKSIMGEVLEAQVNESSQKALEDNGLRPAVPPKVEDLKFDEGTDLEFKLEVEVMPEIEAMDFATLELEKPVAPVEESEVDEAVLRLASNIRKTRPLRQPSPAQSGDAPGLGCPGMV